MELKSLVHGKNGNRYCGPAVLSMITGISTGEAAAAIRKNTGRRSVITTYCGELKTVLRQCGYNVHNKQTYRNIKTAPTLAKWLREYKTTRTSGRVFLILAGRHWQLITGNRYACGRGEEDIVTTTHEKVPRRARVREVFEITEQANPTDKTNKTLDEIYTWLEDRALTRTTTILAPRKASKLLAKEHGIDIDVDNMGFENYNIYIYPPQWVLNAREAGIVEYESVAYDWPECLDTLKDIIKMMEEMK